MAVSKIGTNALASGLDVSSTNISYTGTLTGGTGVVNIGSGQVYKDSSGNVGIGTSSPTVRLQVTSGSTGTLAVQSTGTSGQYPSSGSGMEFVAGSASAQDSIISYNRTSSSWRDLYLQANTLLFGTAGSERARIDSSGNFYVGKTTISAATRGFSFSGTGSATFVDSQTGDGPQIQVSNIWSSVLNGYRFFSFRINASANEVGSISTNGSSTTSYNTSSDYRLKENIQPMTGALAKVALLKPCTYTWKADGSAGEGFIAHELQEVAPDAVTGEKDAVNEDGSIKPQGIDTSFLVATLTAAIQELKAELDSVKAELAVLKGV